MERFNPILMLQKLEMQMHNSSRNMVQAFFDTMYIYQDEVCKSAYKHLSPSFF